ncbi:MAG: hypothetical protein C0436_00195 [Alphaproteobacteria bacterium]|nr:hypothetical protein [Alphaproteobacteria bacterium]
MYFMDLEIVEENDRIVLRQNYIDDNCDVHHYKIEIPPEQAMLVSKAIKVMACEILDEDVE